jgi:hypothetical protein
MRLVHTRATLARMCSPQPHPHALASCDTKQRTHPALLITTSWPATDVSACSGASDEPSEPSSHIITWPLV